MAKKDAIRDSINIKGFFRLNIVNQDGKIAGDSGWKQNQITNLGFNNYLAKLLGSLAGSVQVGFVALGTGGAPAAGDTTLAGEVMSSTKRTAITAASSSNSKAVQFTATFPSGFLSAAANLSNIGLYNATTTNDTLFAGNTYASSACATNQAVNVTYTINFA